jgi:hypothetical protein
MAAIDLISDQTNLGTAYSAVRYRAEDLRAWIESRPSGGERVVEAK